MSAPAPLVGPLADNPTLSRWVSFPEQGKVLVSTGRVEFGQGVLTAMRQVAADELEVARERIVLRSGDTELTPNEGYTAGSQSFQFGAVAMRQACAEVRTKFLAQAAKSLNCDISELSVKDGAVLRGGKPSGHDYWTLAPHVSLDESATGAAVRKPLKSFSVIGQSDERTDLPAKVFGQATFIHDIKMDGMVHARVVRQPNKGATLDSIDEAAIRRAAKGEIEFVRHGNFLAILGDDERMVETAATAAPNHVVWQGVEKPMPQQQEAKWLMQRPAIDRLLGEAEPVALEKGQSRFEQTYTRGYLAHASIGPSCGIAQYDGSKVTVWTHCQGVYPLRGALVRALGMDAANVHVKHVQGPGCYGHNGADDAAADAAVIAKLKPGRPIRVRWRREEEFGFEPFSPAMIVKVRAVVDENSTPVDWTAEIWSGNHNGRPGGGNNLLAEYALPDATILPPAADTPEANGGGGTRNSTPLYDIAQKRIIHHMITEPPVRVSALRGLGAMPNVFALESAMDELAERAGMDPVEYRLKHMKDERCRRVIEHTATMANWKKRGEAGTGRGLGFAFSQYKNKAGYCGVVVDLEVDEEIRLLEIWCATEAGLVVNPDGALNQIEGGIIQSASWVLKEQVRFDEGVVSLDWETYPVLKFSEIPPIHCELLPSDSDAPLGIGEVTAGPTAAAIGNAVSHALGTRVRDLPLTRERIMATLLA